MKRPDAIILAGGLGTRLRKVFPDLPKPLAPVNGEPFLTILLRQLKTFGVERVVLAVGYKAESVMAAYSDRSDYGLEIAFSVEPEPLGTGGAIKRALALTRGPEVLVLNGDSYAEVSPDAFYAFHKDRRSLFTLALRRVNDTGRYGRVETDASGKILSFAEKAAGSGLVNAGIYLASRAVFSGVPEDKKISLENAILPALAGHGAYGFETSGLFIDIGLPETYKIADSYLRMRKDNGN